MVAHITKNGAVNLGVWAVLVLLTAFSMTLLNHRSLGPSRAMKSTEGNVIGYVPGEELSYRYQYTVKGRSFQGSAKPPQRIETMKLGGTVTVFYEEENPGTSMLAPPRTVVVTRVGLIVMVSVVIPILLMWLLHRRGLLPPCKFVQDCREWVALRIGGSKGQMPASRASASPK
ncbi:MAG TPA: DUF3592 domain-containing protein [Verrucomicrobiae bacterium]|nr:DUF3592 domain-containing protein [Verrucomicrobiae bacterium]